MRARCRPAKQPTPHVFQVIRVSDKRPVNLSIPTIQLPVTAYVSILHRLSGLVLIVAFGAFLYALHYSLASPGDFDQVVAALQRTSCRVGIWVLLAALAYHSCAGVRHLLMDCGIGESLKGGVLGARLVLVASVLLMVLAFIWVKSW